MLMQNRMDGWFEKKRRGRGCRIFAFPRGNKIWFLVRHGLPMRREGKHLDDGENGIAFYRPQQHDVLIYDAETDEMGVNAGTKGERTLYLEVIGDVLFGDENYFDLSERFTLDPLREVGPASLECEDIEGIAQRPPGRDRQVLGRQPSRAWRSGRPAISSRPSATGGPTQLTGGSLDRMPSSRSTFEGSKRERTVTIRPANIARYERDSDTDVIDAWLKARGFCQPTRRTRTMRTTRFWKSLDELPDAATDAREWARVSARVAVGGPLLRPHRRARDVDRMPVAGRRGLPAPRGPARRRQHPRRLRREPEGLRRPRSHARRHRHARARPAEADQGDRRRAVAVRAAGSSGRRRGDRDRHA